MRLFRFRSCRVCLWQVERFGVLRWLLDGLLVAAHRLGEIGTESKMTIRGVVYFHYFVSCADSCLFSNLFRIGKTGAFVIQHQDEITK